MKLNFVIDKQYDSAMLFQILQKYPGKLDWFIKRSSSLKIIQRSEKTRVIKFLNKAVNEKYEKTLPYLRKTLKLYQRSWNEINKNFFQTTEKITGYQWKYKTYFCVLSPFHKGISSWGGNKIVRSWQENPYTMRKITAHELLISHIFTIFERDFKEENLSNKQKWALAEISAWAITGLENKMLKFWPWISEEEKYPLNHNYPELYDLQRILKPKYEKKKNFKEFLLSGIHLVKINKKFLK